MVEWKKLGDIATLQKTKNKKHLTENAYSITQAGLVPTKSFFKEKTNITSHDTSGYYIVEKDWFVYSPSRIDVGSINYLKDDGPVIVSPIDVVFSVDANICLPSYLLEYFFTYKGKKDLLKRREGVEGMGRRNLPFNAIKSVQIPIPSLSEQQRIVGILDTFTSSISNLKEQLALRRKQYEHYRDELLDLEGKEGVEMKTIGEVCDVITGGEVPENTIKGQQAPTESHPFAVYTNGKDTYGYADTYQVDSDVVCVSSIGANTGAIFYKTGKFTPAIRLKVLIPHYGVNTKFLYYASMKIDFKGRNTGSVPNINANYVKSKSFFLPSLSEQSRIVSFLDTFEASISNLEAQIAAREKQYEYYRNKLLTFE
ncbi:MAG: restriction endonuclease subunit S [Bacteroidaceae bacterium]|nr:restriction endonuclease subunit S [Bacteroidaceae bacterium]